MKSHAPGFGTFFLARLLEIEFTFSEDSSLLRFPVRDYLFNPGGTLHGGIVATVMDMSMGHLLNHCYGPGAATLEMKVQYVAAMRQGDASCEAHFLKRGRSVAFLESRLFDGAHELVAVATSTWKIRAPATTPAART